MRFTIAGFLGDSRREQLPVYRDPIEVGGNGGRGWLKNKQLNKYAKALPATNSETENVVELN